MFSRNKILVAGGAGFVGSNLVDFLLENDASEIYILDNLLSSDVSNISLDNRVKFIYGSANDVDVLDRIPHDLDYAFNLICFHGNQSSIEKPFDDHEHNTLTALSLFNKLSQLPNLKKVVYAAAACAVAEKTFESPIATTEDQPISLYHDSPYSISKIIGELYGNYFFQRNGLPIVKARFSNVYGPKEILGAGSWRGTHHTVWRNVIPTFIWKSLQREALPLDNGGNASRDFIYVRDMVRGLALCALHGEAGEVYNLATGRETTIYDLASLINSITGNETPLDLKPARDWDRSGKRFASTEKAEKSLGFRATTKIEKGITNTVRWFADNEYIISNNIKKHTKLLNGNIK